MNRTFIKKIIKALLVFLLFNYSWMLQAIPFILFNMKSSDLTGHASVMLSFFSSFVLGIILLFIYRKDLKSDFLKFKKKFSFNLDIGLRYWVIGLAGMMVANFFINVIFNGGQAGNEEAVQNMISSLPWLMLINAGFLAPWNEEIVFRKTLKDIFKKKWVYVLISGLIFGLAHVLGNVNTWTDWLFVVSYGSLGAAFAAAYYDTDTIFTPMTFHIIHNFVLVLLSII